MTIYNTKKRKLRRSFNKIYAVLISIAIVAGTIGFNTVKLYKEIELITIPQEVKAEIKEVEIEKDIIEKIWDMADQAKMEKRDIIKMLSIIQCESNFDKYALNWNAKSKSFDAGIVQWNDKFHPEISRECAFSIDCAISEMIKLFQKKGNFNDWICNK